MSADIFTVKTVLDYNGGESASSNAVSAVPSTACPAPVVTRSSTLQWQASDLSGTYNWSASGTACANQGTGWRLPTKDELINSLSSVGLQSYAGYWSSDTDSANVDSAWAVYMFTPPTPYSKSQLFNYHVRCVQNTVALNQNSQALASISDAIARIFAEIQAMLNK